MSSTPGFRDRARGAVFDLDGTLVDSYSPIAESLNAARSAYGLAPLPVDVVRRSVGRGLEELITRWVGADRIEDGVRRFRECYARVYARGTVALPGVPETLEMLDASGLAMAVASNKPARFSTAILDSLGLLGRFRAVHGPDTVGSTKPDPTMIRRCLSDMELDSSRVVYVGDMPLDVESARRADLSVILVAGGSASIEELRATGEPVLERLSQLPGALSDRLRRGNEPRREEEPG